MGGGEQNCCDNEAILPDAVPMANTKTPAKTAVAMRALLATLRRGRKKLKKKARN